MKKLYYLIYDDEVPGKDGKDPALADAIHAFKSLWNLKYATDENGKKFSSYLQMLRDWRNDEAHNAPCSSDAELDAAIKVVVALYLYVTAYSITDLEMAEGNATTAKVIPYKLPSDESQVKMAAEDIHDRK